MDWADEEKYDECLVIRVMREEDLDAVVAIDSMYLGKERPDYYRSRFEPVKQGEGVNLSLVAEHQGTVVGFIMGALFHGEFGIPERRASIESIGIHPEYKRKGTAVKLMEQYLSNVRALNVDKVHTLVSWDDLELLAFFKKMDFKPSSRVPLERKP